MPNAGGILLTLDEVGMVIFAIVNCEIKPETEEDKAKTIALLIRFQNLRKNLE